VEREAYPENYQTTIAKNCFAAGADLIIGAHPHVLQGIEFMDGKPVFYSLGNYIFAQTIAKTALVKVEVQPDGEATYSLIPAYAKDGQTKAFIGDDAVELFDYMNEISPRAFIDENGYIYDTE
jgi:poly-gamma-glutamate synthesis protein (capsule biosynthesis protein)